MKKIFSNLIGLSLLLIFCQQVFAQNYRPFRMGYNYSFIARDSVYSMRIDLTKIIYGDSVFVFNKTVKKGIVRTGPSACIGRNYGNNYHIQANNQFGYWMRKAANGDYIFRNAQGSEFLVKTQAAINSSWAFSINPNITATLVSLAPEIIGNVTDNVQTINLSNGAQIKLSQNYGFVKAPNFMAYVPNSDFKNRTLQLNNLPEKILTIWHTNYIPPISKIYDFQPGDKFSFYSDSSIAAGWMVIKTWDQYEVLTRTNTLKGDSIYYIMEHNQLTSSQTRGWQPTFTLAAPKTKKLRISLKNNYPEGNLLTNEFIENGSSFYNKGIIQALISRSSTFNLRETKFFINYIYNSQCSVFRYTPDEERSYRYTVGLGKTGEWVYDMSYMSSKVLQAYIKGTETYGTWLSLTQIQNNITGNKEDKEPTPFAAFPNPFTNELSLKFSDTFKGRNATVLIKNTLGLEVYQQQLTAAPNQETKLQLPETAKGIYVLQVTENEKTYTTRLVKE